jgi:CRP/FNR family cyclic AMP-dependent transcriptional regulator
LASARVRIDSCKVVTGEFDGIAGPSSARCRQTRKTLTHASARFGNPGARAAAIAQASPFSAWPREALDRLAAASGVSSQRDGTYLIVAGQRCDMMTVVAEGTVFSSVSSPEGRRLTFKIDDSSFAYGLASLVDGQALQIDLIADGPVAVIRTPLAAIRTELTHMPALWESIAVEVIRRSRRYATQLNQFVFDPPLVRAASLLLGLLTKGGKDGTDGPVAIDFRLSQERMAEMLGTSRQWVTALVRELSSTGVVEWRYGRVTVRDVQALRTLAAQGIDVLDQRGAGLDRQRAARPAGRLQTAQRMR